MNKNNLSKLTSVLIALVFVLGSFYFGTYIGHTQASTDTTRYLLNKETDKPSEVDFAIFWKAWNILDQKYVATGTSTESATSEERIYGAIKGMTEAMGDPYTVFFPPQETKKFEESISGNFEGVGMEMGIKDDVLTVVSPLQGTPASKAGILAGDKILGIDKISTEGLSIDKAIERIRGKEGTTVTLTVQRGEGAPFEVEVVRAVINIPTIEVINRPDGVFVIRLFSFSSDSPRLFRNALREFSLTKSDKLIVDLRGNPGGYLEAAVDIASWFLPAGKIVVREDFGEEREEETLRSKGYDIFSNNLKLIILIDGGSASASEILAGALRDHKKAQLLGTKSFGKGSVQELVQIDENTSLKVTIARWLTPNKVSISKEGIVPDVLVELTEEDIKNKYDRQLEQAVELLKQ